MKRIIELSIKGVGLALALFAVFGLVADVANQGVFTLKNYNYTKMVIGAVIVGLGFSVPGIHPIRRVAGELYGTDYGQSSKYDCGSYANDASWRRGRRRRIRRRLFFVDGWHVHVVYEWRKCQCRLLHVCQLYSQTVGRYC